VDGRANGSQPPRSLETLTSLRRIVVDVDASGASCASGGVANARGRPLHTIDGDDADDSDDLDELDSSIDIGDSFLDISTR